MKKILKIIIIILVVIGIISGCNHLLKHVKKTVINSNRQMAKNALDRRVELISDYEKVKNISDLKGLKITKTSKINAMVWDVSFSGDYWILHNAEEKGLIFVSKDKKIRMIVNDIEHKYKVGKKTGIPSNGVMNLNIWRKDNKVSAGVKLNNPEKWDCFACSYYDWIQGFWFFDKDGNVIDFVLTMDESGNFWYTEMGK